MSGAHSPGVIAPGAVAASLDEHWSKLLGVFGWHTHDNEDEMFLVLKGRLRIEMEAGAVEIGEGEFCVVPKGVRHNPVAEREVHVMLFERKSTLHSGNEKNEKTRSIADQLRPVESKNSQ